ncbi:hypothetical protein PR202_ga04642 [Eleusine coracana subsp. coracana]|uniref:SBP-type domain-containing protein n=1 Tax=Eleusine coracana subsp. coracana TaxID=191504 RepID=A0AAV5BSB2_ELECO|nr:hypothetical protein PR202_ga04642 [Eleusine coracana subsp. coracana]
MDVPDAGGGGVDAGEPVWDWGNLLDFVVQDDDSLVLPWDDAAGIGAADPTEAAPSMLATPPPQPAEVEPDPEPEIEPEPGPVLPPPQLQAQGIGRRVRKRDPRLVCPNYLAGMVPCACPEVDEMAAAAEVEDVATELLAGARKKVKTAGRRGKAGADVVGGGGVAAAGGVAGAGRAAAAEMRCQVPGCEADIRELKGYHRRHRVCLRCAHAASVMLDGIQKRYCQQCGKFHILLDFDEDKRSCRRKLERHNKRRRRKPDSKGPIEKEMDEHLDLSADVSGDGELREENIEGTSTEMLETVLSDKLLDRETPVGSEDVLSSPTCTQPSLHNEQSKSIVTFVASVETCIGAKQESVKLTSSPIHDTKSAYSSRSLLSFDGDYLKHDCFRLTSLDAFDCVEKGDLRLDSQHEIFRISISQSRPNTHGPAFVEVENVSGLSNFVPILFGSKQLCSELEKIQDILCGSSCKNNGIFGVFPDASSNPCERHKFQNTAMSGFLVDIGWLIKTYTPEEFKHALSLTNTQRWVCMLKFLIRNDFFNVLEIIVKSMDNIIGSEILSNMERGRLEDHITTFLGHVNHARSIVYYRAKHGKETQLETRHVIDNFPKQPSLGTSVPLDKGNTGLGGDNDLHSDSAACNEEVTTPLVTKDSSHRQCCHSSHRQCCRPDISPTWLKPSLLVLSFSTRIE